MLASTKDAGKRRDGRRAGWRSFEGLGRGDLHRRLAATRAALRRNWAAGNRHQAARASHDGRTWQVERRKRTRHLIELGGLVVKAGIVDLTGDDRAVIYGALLWMAEKLQSDQGGTRAGAVGREGEAGIRQWLDPKLFLRFPGLRPFVIS